MVKRGKNGLRIRRSGVRITLGAQVSWARFALRGHFPGQECWFKEKNYPLRNILLQF